MRTLLVLTVATLGACTDPAPTASGPPMPSARRTGGEGLDPGVIPPPACMTRWYYTDFDITFDCSTALVNGDPHHFVTSCPVPAFLDDLRYWHPPSTDEQELDAARHLIHRVSTYDVPPNGIFAVTDTVNVYNTDGLLQETTVKDGAEVDSHSVVTSRNASGQPLAISVDRRPWELGGKTYPDSAHLDLVFGYDEIGRLSSAQSAIVATGFVYYDRTIAYDDVARRRNYDTIVDISGLDPDLPGAGDNRRYDLLDDNDLVIELGNTTPGDPVYYVDYRYDEQERLVSEITTAGAPGTTHYKISYIYDCP